MRRPSVPNFDDPVEYLAAPEYLGGLIYRIVESPADSAIVHARIRVTVEYLIVTAQTRRGER